MKTLMRMTSLLIALMVFTSQAQARENVVDIRSWTTTNGVPVFFVEREQIPMVDIAVLFDAGSRRDQSHPGIASLTASLMGQGSKKFDADQIANGFENVGAEFGASVGRDIVSFHLRTLTEHAAVTQSMNIFKSILTEPTFPQKQFDRLRKQTLTGLQLRQQNASAKAVDLFYQNLYPEGPYQFPVSGTTESISALKVNDVQDYYQRNFVTGSAKIVIVGDVSEIEARALANDITKGMIQGLGPIQVKAKLKEPAGMKIKEHFSGPQTAIVMGQLGIDREDPHYYVLTVGNAILGGLPFYSRLFSEVREKQGLSYHVASDFDPLKVKGPFSIILQTQNEKADQAIKVTQDTVKKFLLKGPSAAELDIAKKNIRGQFPLAFASNASILGQVSRLAFYDLPMSYFDEYRDNINNVTQLQIQQAFKKLLHQDNWLLVRVGNA